MAYNSKYTGAQVEAQLDKVDGKQDIISDLATIRSGAALGATALQTETYKGTVTGIKMNGASKGTSGVVDLGTVITAHQDISGKADKSSLAAVATSGSYNDLSNKPTIPAAVTESTVSGWGFTKNTGTYSKPSTGIPKSDLASAVQTSLGKADTALQSYTEQYKGTVTGVKVNGSTKSPSSGTVDIGNVVTSVKINGTTKSPSSGVVDLGTVVTDISGKQDKLVSGTNIKTINGTSLLGSGNIVISGGGGGSSSGSGAYAEVNHGTSDTTFTLTPNTFHVWDEVASLTLTLGSETSGVANEFLFQFTSGATATSLTLPDDIKWANDTAPTIAENMKYQISVLNGLAVALEFSNAAALIDNLCTYDGSKTVTFQYPVDSDVTVSVAGKTVQISKGEKSGSFSGLGEPMGKITGIAPPFDKTYNYVY